MCLQGQRAAYGYDTESISSGPLLLREGIAGPLYLETWRVGVYGVTGYARYSSPVQRQLRQHSSLYSCRPRAAHSLTLKPFRGICCQP